eukprot:jgi/Tetstr1/422540/TSEL_013348.t1
MPPPTYAVPLEAAPYELAWHCLAAALARCEVRLTPLTRRLAQKLYANAADGWLAGLTSTLGRDAAANLPEDDNTAWDFNTLGQIWKRPQWLAELVLPELGLQQLDDASQQLRHDFDELLFLRSVQAHPYEAGHGDRLPVVGKLIEGVGTAHRLVATLAPMLEPEACNDEVLSGLLDESRSLNGGESGDDAIFFRDTGSIPKLLLQLSLLAVESGLIPAVRALQRYAKLPGPEDFPRKKNKLGSFDNAVGLATYIGYCLPEAARGFKGFPLLRDIVDANINTETGWLCKSTGWPGAHSCKSALNALKVCRALCYHSSSKPPTLENALLAQQACDQLLAAFLPADDAIRAVSRRRTAWLHGALQTELPSDISVAIRKSADTLLPHLASSAERSLLTRKRIIDESCIEASGRQAVLEQLVERLRAEEAPPETRSTVLWGTSGTGKTSLANLAVHKAAPGAFTAVLSLQGSSEATLRLGLEAFARSEPRVRVQRDDSADEALTKLGVYLRSHDMWCALVDDVAVEAADIWRYIPEGRGQLLMTATRDLGLPEESAIRLPDLSVESSVRLLVRLVRGKETAVEAYLQPREEVEALLAGPLVGGLPIMVAEVAAIIGNRSKPFLEVAAELRDAAGSCLEGINSRDYMLGGPMGSMKLWMLRLAERRGANMVRAAERVLAVCALLEPTGIPVSLLAEVAVRWDAKEGLGMAGHIAQSLAAEEGSIEEERRLEMERMIEEWKAKVVPGDEEPRRKLMESLAEALRSLAASRSSWEEEQQPLQQQQRHDHEVGLEVDAEAGVGQEGDAGREADDLAEVLTAAEVLEERNVGAKDSAVPGTEGPVREGLTEQLAEALTAVEACGNLLEALPGGGAVAMHGVFQSCALKLFAGEAAEAASAVRRALASCYSGDDHEDVERKKEWLPCAQHYVAKALSEDDMMVGEEEERLELAKLLSGVGNFLRFRMGDLAGTEGLLKSALDIREQQLGPHNPHTASSLNNLAGLHKAKGDYAAAQPLMERALDIREEQLGPRHPSTAASLNNLAGLHQAKGDYAAAQPLMERALDITEQQLGPQHPDTAASLNNLANLYKAKGDYAAAQPLMERALDITEQQLGPHNPHTASSLNNLASLHQDKGDYAAAQPLMERALDITEQQLGPQHPDTAASLNNLAQLHKAKGDYAAAQPLMERALGITEQQLGPRHPDTAASLNNLAQLHQAKGDYAAAQPLYERALGISEQQLGPRHPHTATSLGNLAGLHQDKGDYAAAQALMERALDIREQQLGPRHPDTATSLNNLANLYKAKGDYAAAQPLMERALGIMEQQLGPRHPDTAASLNNLAQLHQAQGDYAAAQPLYERALDIREQQLGPRHPDTAASLNNLAQLHRAKGDYAAAQPLYERALGIMEQQLGPRHPDTATSLDNLAGLHKAKGDYAAAQPLMERALDIREQQLGPRHPDTATSLNNLAGLHKAKGDYVAAQPLMERALGIMEQQLGPRHPDTAASLNNLAGLHQAKGEYAAAQALTERALDISEQQLGPRHPDTAASLGNLAALHQAKGNYAAAQPLYERALAIRQQQLGPRHPDTAASLNNLATLLAEKKEYIAAHPHMEKALSIWAERLGPHHPDTLLAAQSLRNILFDARHKMKDAFTLRDMLRRSAEQLMRIGQQGYAMKCMQWLKGCDTAIRETGPKQKCPCGSGKKYAKCHMRKP